MSDVVKGVKQKNKQARIIYFAIEHKSMQPKPRYGKFPFSLMLSLFLKDIKIKLRSIKSSEHIYEKGDGSYRGFDYYIINK